MKNGFLGPLITAISLTTFASLSKAWPLAKRACFILLFLLMSSTSSYAEGASLNLKNADIHSLIETVAIATGKNFIIDPRVQGKVTVVSSSTVSLKNCIRCFYQFWMCMVLLPPPVAPVLKLCQRLTLVSVAA